MRTTQTALLLTLALSALACEKQSTDTATPEPKPQPEPVAPVAVVKPIPDGFFELTPSIAVVGVDAAVEFYGKAFGAQKLFALPGPDGKTMHAEIKIGDSIIMIDEENLQQGARGPASIGGSPATLMIYAAVAEDTVAAAQAAGATVKMPVEEQFWGDRYGQVVDPFGHQWAVASHVEDLSPEQMNERAALMMAAMDPKAKKKKKAKKGAPPAWKAIVGTPATTATPAPYHTVTPAYVLHDAAAAIEFYKTVFGAQEKARMTTPDGKIMHAELAFGNSVLMLSDESPQMGSKSAKTLGGSPVSLMLYTPDVDGVFAKATAAGAQPAMPVADMFWGDRFGMLAGPDGFPWGVATHKEDLTPEQIAQRSKKAAATPAS
jgi:PhnB protein